MKQTIDGVSLRRSVATGRHGWVGIIDGVGVQFKPFLGWRSRKPIEWQIIMATDDLSVVTRATRLRDAVALARKAVIKGLKSESCE